MNTFKPRDQILYMPKHAKGRRSHKDVEEGFVFKVTEAGVFCRFFNKGPLFGLRTASCSELVNPSDLFLCNHRAQVYIKEHYEAILKEQQQRE